MPVQRYTTIDLVIRITETVASSSQTCFICSSVTSSLISDLASRGSLVGSSPIGGLLPQVVIPVADKVSRSRRGRSERHVHR